MRCQSDSGQRQILDLVLAGHSSKNIVADLGISQRSVDTIARQMRRKRLEVPPGPDPHSDCCRLGHKTARCRVWLPGDDEQMSTFRVCSCQGRHLR